MAKRSDREKIQDLADFFECDSPIETDLLVSLFKVSIENKLFSIVRFGKSIFTNSNPTTPTELFIEKQVGIIEYRIDFRLNFSSINKDNSISKYSILVECDGHDFHEKTKEQARKDKSRDKKLQLLGYRVIRFAGSEIFKNSDKCAFEALTQLISVAEMMEPRSWPE